MEPKRPLSRLGQQESGLEQEQEQTTQARQTQGREFESPEDLLRYDAAQTAPPPTVERRLKESVEKEAPLNRPWWKRLLGLD
jgi:hypothetical protein